MIVHINGRNFPGIDCTPGPGAVPNKNIHVGIGNRGQAEQLFRGDAASATWQVEVRAIAEASGAFDYRGALVQGPRGDRFIYLNWGSVDEDGDFHLFRRAKVMLSDLHPDLVRVAIEQAAELHADIDLTDEKGNPTCARLRAPAITWSVVHQPAPASTPA